MYYSPPSLVIKKNKGCEQPAASPIRRYRSVKGRTTVLPFFFWGRKDMGKTGACKDNKNLAYTWNAIISEFESDLKSKNSSQKTICACATCLPSGILAWSRWL